MKFYIACSKENAPLHNHIRNFLIDVRHEITFDWTRHLTTGKIDRTQLELFKLGESMKLGVDAADYVVVILPGGRGTHVELGMAIIADKPIFLLDVESPKEDLDFAFYHTANVHHFKISKFQAIEPSVIFEWAQSGFIP